MLAYQSDLTRCRKPENPSKTTNLERVTTIPRQGAGWLSDRLSDSWARSRGFETYFRRVVSLSKTFYFQKVLVHVGMEPPLHDGKIIDWDVMPQHKETKKTNYSASSLSYIWVRTWTAAVTSECFTTSLFQPLYNAVVLAFYSSSTHFRLYRLSSIIFLYSVHGQASWRQHILVHILLPFNDNCS